MRQCPGANNLSFSLSSRFFYVPSRGRVSLFEKVKNPESANRFKKIDLEIDEEKPKIVQKLAILDCDVTHEVFAVITNISDLYVCNLSQVLRGDSKILELFLLFNGNTKGG